MAFTEHFQKREFECLSTDTKKTTDIRNGDELVEIDTGNRFKFNVTAGAWVAYTPKVDAELNVEGLTVETSAVVHDTLLQGNLAVTASAQPLAADVSCNLVTVQADPENTGYVYVGNASVTTSAFSAKLSPGSSVTYTVSNVNKIYVVGSVDDNVSYGGEV